MKTLLAAVAIALAVAPVSAQIGQRGDLRGRLAGRQGQRQAKGAETAEIAGRHVSIWRPMLSDNTRAPLVIFSHGFHGTGTQSAFLMRALAADGYLVVAPNHKDAGLGGRGLSARPEMGFGKPDDWTDAIYKDRADDIASLLLVLKSDPQWSSAIEWSQVALAGHSLGGYTVLGLAGAWPRWKLPDVKAVLALSPYAAPFIHHGSLGNLGVPVMYQGGTRDIGISPSLRMGGGAFDITAAPSYYVEFQGAGHLAWTDLVAEYQAGVEYYSLAFLDRHVRGERTADPSRKRDDVASLRMK
jgi:predicted dienelactone hydrolase